jgi:hypothetical protein
MGHRSPSISTSRIGISLASMISGKWARATLERFDWRAATALRQKNRKTWDAVRQLIRYREVVGHGVPISVESIQTGALFVEPAAPAE